ncbi:C40 family peptidase [Kitasatospora viridis]|nr:C40 family peptidase [Kitasatospora viridis]
MKPDLNSIATPPTADPSTPPTHRAARLRHRVGLAAAMVAGAGSIALGADLAVAAPATAAPTAQPAAAFADDPDGQDTVYGTDGANATDDGTSGTDDTSASDDVNATDDSTDATDPVDATDDTGATGATDDSASGMDDTVSGTDDSATTDSDSDGGMRQGWDGSVYWFRNEAGEWRYTSHRDVYLERTNSGSGSDTGSSSADNGESRSRPAPTASRGSVETAVQFALAQLGKPFVMGGNGPNGYDCSGLIQQSFRRAGIDLPRVADDQYLATTPIDASRLRRGDLLFWSYDGTPGGIHHGAIYLGDDKFVEAAKPGTTVRISHLNHGYWPSFMGRP